MRFVATREVFAEFAKCCFRIRLIHWDGNERHTTRDGFPIQGVLLTGHSLCSIEHWMPKLNPALFEPLTRIENACRRVSGVMLNAPNLTPKDSELVRREIQE